MKPWHFGNTTVRSAFRLRDGLVALSASSLIGDLGGHERESEFAWLLDEAGVVSLDRGHAEDVSDLGRKWRAAMTQLGFLVPELRSTSKNLDQSWIGRSFTLTANGRRLIASETVPAMQECFLRSLAAYRIPSVLEPRYHVEQFSPLRLTLAIMMELDQRIGDSRLDFMELAVIVQVSHGGDSPESIVNRIIEFRTQRESSDAKRRFDNEALVEVSRVNGLAASTYRDYADCNIRYLKATGIVLSQGRGIAIVPEKRVLVAQLIEQPLVPMTPREYLVGLCAGAALPTDHRASAEIVLDDLVERARARGLTFNLAGRPRTDVADISILRYELEELIAEDKEIAYAADQVNLVEEISEYLRLIAERATTATLPNGQSIFVPKSEAPAYLEWATWRAFLAMNELVSKPYECRRFKVDQDFLPIGTAPGGGPDLIFEFDSYVLVVEVTLTESSRQEAAEGEPVRRHVADIALDHSNRGTGKPIYGLFLANKIDSNTAETFRIGVWYFSDDSRTQLDIVPITLTSFRDFFDAVVQSHAQGHTALLRTLNAATAKRDMPGGAPAWKTEVDQLLRTANL